MNRIKQLSIIIILTTSVVLACSWPPVTEIIKIEKAKGKKIDITYRINYPCDYAIVKSSDLITWELVKLCQSITPQNYTIRVKAKCKEFYAIEQILLH